MQKNIKMKNEIEEKKLPKLKGSQFFQHSSAPPQALDLSVGTNRQKNKRGSLQNIQGSDKSIEQNQA